MMVCLIFLNCGVEWLGQIYLFDNLAQQIIRIMNRKTSTETTSFLSPHPLALYLILSLFLVLSQQANKFCSVYCVDQQCSAWSSNTCSQCIAPFTKNTGTGLCEVTAASGWVLVDTSSDISGAITPNVTGTTTCGSSPWRYRYFGNLTGTDKIIFVDSTGPAVPHYQMRIIVWVILIDGWAGSDTVRVTLNNNQTLTMAQSAKTSSETVCGGGPKQDYLRFDQTYSHTAIASYNVTITTNNTSSKWGVKELVVLVKTCHPACAICWGPLITQCTLCLQESIIYKLSGTTCNQSCLAGYGDTAAGEICVFCDMHCVVCFQTATNCSQCQPSGVNASFLYPWNFTCLAACPNGTYANNTDRTCYLCVPECLQCSFNSTYCYQCDTALGYAWLNYTCVTSCPNLYFLSNNNTNCTTCSQYCSVCHNSSNNCSVCTLSGPNMAFLDGTSCVQTCPAQKYPDTGGGLVNLCLPCDFSCQVCTGSPTPCSQCAPNYFLYLNVCSTSCPTDYFGQTTTWTCLACSVYCVDATMDMYFPNSVHDMIYVDLTFTDDLDFTTFPYQSYQSFSIDSDLYTLDMFSFTYQILGTRSYRIIVQPKGYIFLYNATITCTVMSAPTPTHTSASSRPFKVTAYGMKSQLTWFVIKSPEMSSAQKTIIEQVTQISNQIMQFTTKPYFQQVKKSGLFMFLFSSAQITTCSVLVNNVPAQNMYSGVRFWGSFVFLDVPEWEQNSNITKYFVSQPVQDVIKNARLLEECQGKRRMLFDANGIQWRFTRTGHTSFFIYDTYPVIALLVLSWICLIVLQIMSKSCPKSHKAHSGKVYTFIHKIHQISIMYITLNAILQWLYFSASSLQRWLSLAFSILINIYFLAYELYIYYDMMKYPVARLGNEKFEYYASRYGCYLKNIRHEDYNMLEPWSPRYWFRPYNYHILSYYKKLIMIASLPIFYHITHAQPAVLCLIQAAEIARFCFIWPFATKLRNIVRLVLECVLLGFFICVLIQGFIVQEIMRNDEATLMSNVEIFYKLGWIGFVFVFVFNGTFLITSFIDIVRGCSLSNQEQMAQVRHNFYYSKLRQYELQNLDVPQKQINRWIKQGNLNKKNLGQLPEIWVRIQNVRFGKRNDGNYEVEIKKMLNMKLKQQINLNHDNNIVGEKFHKQFTLSRKLNKFYYQLAQQLFEYSPFEKSPPNLPPTPTTASQSLNSTRQIYEKLPTSSCSSQIQFITVKTFLLVDQSLYKAEQSIRYDAEKMKQKIVTENYSGEKKVVKMRDRVLGFPISDSNLALIL